MPKSKANELWPEETTELMIFRKTDKMYTIKLLLQPVP